MKNIIFFTESLVTIGGVVRVITNWSNHFVNKGYRVENVSVYQGKPYFELDSKVKFTILDIKFRYKLFKLLDIVPNAIKLYKFLKNKPTRTNVVFNKSLYVELVWILRKLGLLKHLNLIYMHHGGSSGFKSFYLSRKSVSHRVSMMFNAFDKVVCLYDDEKHYPKQVDKSKLHFVPNPLSFERSNIDFQEKENIVLSLGRVTKAKGIDTLIFAWSKIEKEAPNWRLLIVGEGEDKKEFINLSNSLGLKNIEFVKGTTNVKPLYEKSKIFVIPSVAEGFGMTIVEAMACKCCVISSKTAGGIKLVDENSGILFDIGDKEALANNLNSLINNSNLIQSLALSAYEDIKNYEIKNLEKLWGDIFE